MNPKQLKQALSVSDPEAVIIKRSNINPRHWVGHTIGGEWRCTSSTQRDCAQWARSSQAMLRRLYLKQVRAYCGRTGKRLA
jgi:hypothetical protein